MKAEIDSLHDNSVWELVQLPEGRKPVGSKWVYKVKMKADGSIERCKARLVAQGCSRKQGLDYDETFSPVVRSESVGSVIALGNFNLVTIYYALVQDCGGDLEAVEIKAPDNSIFVLTATATEHS